MLLTKKQINSIKTINGLKEMIECDRFDSLDGRISELIKDNKILGWLFRLSINGYKFVLRDGMVYGIQPKKTNSNKINDIVLLVAVDHVRLEDSLKRVTPYELIMTHALYSDIGCVCINGLSIPVGNDGMKTLEIRKDLSGSDNPYPIPKASCYEQSQCLKPLNGKITISRNDTSMDSIKVIDNVICVWLCSNNKVYVYTK